MDQGTSVKFVNMFPRQNFALYSNLLHVACFMVCLHMVLSRYYVSCSCILITSAAATICAIRKQMALPARPCTCPLLSMVGVEHPLPATSPLNQHTGKACMQGQLQQTPSIHCEQCSHSTDGNFLSSFSSATYPFPWSVALSGSRCYICVACTIGTCQLPRMCYPNHRQGAMGQRRQLVLQPSKSRRTPSSLESRYHYQWKIGQQNLIGQLVMHTNVIC